MKMKLLSEQHVTIGRKKQASITAHCSTQT